MIPKEILETLDTINQMFTLAFIGSTLFLGTITVSHSIKKDLQFRKDALSKYALGTYGWVMSLGLYAIGFAQISLAVALTDVFNISLGNILLVIAGIGTVIVALCKMEYPRKTIRGYIHIFGAGIQFISFPFALLLLSGYFLNEVLHTLTLSVGSLNFLLMGCILFFFVTNTTHEVPYFGLIQKTNIILMTLWVVLISFVFMLG